MALRVFFRKINITHIENIPKDKPVILAANHPTAFVEPCVLACFLDRPLYFLVRGDLFKKNIYARLLQSLHMLPVYRMQDRGYAYLKRNYETFNYCYEALHDNKTVMILAEGNTRHEKRLRALQKGTARIAFGTLEQYPDIEIYIVPVGVNYTYADRYRSDVMIDFGSPILAGSYMKRYRENANQAISEFTEDLRTELEKKVIIIDRILDEELVEYLFLLNRSERLKPFFPGITRDILPFKAEKELADKVNQMNENERRDLLKACRQYFDVLEEHGISDAYLAAARKTDFLQNAVVASGFLPAWAGRFFLYPPARLAKYIADTRVKSIPFYSPVWIAVGIGAFLLYYIFWFLTIAISGRWLFLLPLLFSLPLGYFSVWYEEYRDQWRANRKIQSLEAEVKKELQDMRRVLTDRLWLQNT